jgi:hypothetical protein
VPSTCRMRTTCDYSVLTCLPNRNFKRCVMLPPPSPHPTPLSPPPPHPSPLPPPHPCRHTHTHRHTFKTITMKHRKHLVVLRQSCTALHLHTLLGPKSKYCRHLLAVGSTSSNTAPPWQRKRSCTGKLLPSSVCQFAQNLDMSEFTQGVHAACSV